MYSGYSQLKKSPHFTKPLAGMEQGTVPNVVEKLLRMHNFLSLNIVSIPGAEEG